MIRRILFGILILVAAGLAAYLRLPELDRRPMHGDEANHTKKFRRLWQEGRYVYDPQEYHGPTLYYLTLPAVAAGGARTFAQTTEADYRMVAAVAGVVLVAGVLLIAEPLGFSSAVKAALLMAVSPAMVYYSRYYIHEMLLVAFTFGAIGCGYWYARTGRAWWCLLCGGFVGLMHATKETAVLAWAAAAVALPLTWVWNRLLSRGSRYIPGAAPQTDTSPPRERGVKNPALPGGARGWARGPLCPVRAWHILVAVAIAVALSALLFSGFGANLTGPVDSVGAYATYLFRAGEEGRHVHPWHYYLRMLATGEARQKLRPLSWYAKMHLRVFTRPTPVWSEALILLLAGVGAVAGLTRFCPRDADRRLVRFLVFYSAGQALL